MNLNEIKKIEYKIITNNKLLNQKEFNNITERDIVKIDDNISKSITDILMNEHLIENNNINKKDDSVKVKKYIIKKDQKNKILIFLIKNFHKPFLYIKS